MGSPTKEPSQGGEKQIQSGEKQCLQHNLNAHNQQVTRGLSPKSPKNLAQARVNANMRTTKSTKVSVIRFCLSNTPLLAYPPHTQFWLCKFF